MSVFNFRVLGLIVPKGRARTLRSGRSYTPQRTVDYEMLIGMAAKAAGVTVLTGPVGMALHITLPIPKASKQQAGDFAPVRPDLDNIAKAYLDGLNGIAYVDDGQVCQLFVSKRRGETVGVEVTIRALGSGTE